MTARRVAVLVDGDNVSAVHAAQILSEGAKLGRVDFARVYNNGAVNSEWLSTAGYRTYPAGAGKNSADILLCIDAMELALRDGVEGFVIASSDRDFSHIALRLRERGLHVLGLGEAKAPDGFRKAFSGFVVLKCSKPTTPKIVAPTVQLRDVSENQTLTFHEKIKKLILSDSNGKNEISIASLGAQMFVKYQISTADIPEGNWHKQLSAYADLYDVDEQSPTAMVREKIAQIAAE